MSTVEAIGIVIGVLGLTIAWVTYRKSFPKIPKEELDRREEQMVFEAYYKTVQRTAKEVREGITKYATERGVMDADMFPGITYRSYVKGMTESHAKCLSDEQLVKVLAENYSIPVLRQLKAELEPQYGALVQLKNSLSIGVL